jgi:gas vesicle protein
MALMIVILEGLTVIGLIVLTVLFCRSEKRKKDERLREYKTYNDNCIALAKDFHEHLGKYSQDSDRLKSDMNKVFHEYGNKVDDTIKSFNEDNYKSKQDIFKEIKDHFLKISTSLNQASEESREAYQSIFTKIDERFNKINVSLEKNINELKNEIQSILKAIKEPLDLD